MWNIVLLRNKVAQTLTANLKTALSVAGNMQCASSEGKKT
jgi:hypothetical protein